MKVAEFEIKKSDSEGVVHYSSTKQTTQCI